MRLSAGSTGVICSRSSRRAAKQKPSAKSTGRRPLPSRPRICTWPLALAGGGGGAEAPGGGGGGGGAAVDRHDRPVWAEAPHEGCGPLVALVVRDCDEHAD